MIAADFEDAPTQLIDVRRHARTTVAVQDSDARARVLDDAAALRESAHELAIADGRCARKTCRKPVGSHERVYFEWRDGKRIIWHARCAP